MCWRWFCALDRTRASKGVPGVGCHATKAGTDAGPADSFTTAHSARHGIDHASWPAGPRMHLPRMPPGTRHAQPHVRVEIRVMDTQFMRNMGPITAVRQPLRWRLPQTALAPGVPRSLAPRVRGHRGANAVQWSRANAGGRSACSRSRRTRHPGTSGCPAPWRGQSGQ